MFCHECVRIGAHILMPGTNAKYLRATKAHSDAAVGPLRDEIDEVDKVDANTRIDHSKEPHRAQRCPSIKPTARGVSD